jgi:uncharacterized protein
LFVFIILSVFSTVGASSVWKVSSDTGTLHILRESDFPLPQEFEWAYQDSKILVFESDTLQMQSPEMTQLVISKSVLKGVTLDQILSPEVYSALSVYCVEAEAPMVNVNRLKLLMAMLTIVLAAYQSWVLIRRC